LLYGGIISEDIRIPVGTYKTGSKIGQTRYKIIVKQYELPRLVEPLKGTEVKKGGFWEVNEVVLKRLKLSKEAKKVVDLLNKYAILEKLRGTYLEGYSKLITSMHWEPDRLHTNFNQTSVITGRLSSSRPNLQNCDPQTKVYCESRYEAP
jgi:DNA polymerase I-like protein with 3'-5' exonuclease and polymerase domains